MRRSKIFNKVIRGNISLTDTQAEIILRALITERHNEFLGIATDKQDRINEINCIINDLRDIFNK